MRELLGRQTGFKTVWALALAAALTLGLASCGSSGGWVRRHAAQGDEAPPAEAAADTEEAARLALRLPEFDAAAWYAGRAEDPTTHGVLVESLRPGRVVAAHNADTAFNPASLIKLATTLVALRKLGPDYRFKVHAYAAGDVDKAGRLSGDLFFVGSDPTFGEAGANVFAQELKRLGVKGVAGSVKVSPDFCFNLSDSPQTSGERLAKALRLEKAPKVEVAGVPDGRLLFVYESPPLRETLLYMNAHSVNFIAERVGNRVGGPRGVEQYLENELKIAPDDVLLSTASGLEHNRMTPRAVARVLRALASECDRFGLKPSDLMPVASADAGTLRRRFDGTPLEGAVLGKTGTLTSTDGGMSSLAGFIYADGGEPFVFVILDRSTEVWKYRDMQELLLTDMLRDRITPLVVEVPEGRRLLNRDSARVESRGVPDRVPEAAEEPTPTTAE
ncbi:MAG TPA: D-alanyl-D-alanine carboxypeptidase [Pyrinomonadaceae bacterium]|nr:D-alanyl-D-alanine carboxypeptidase [Pyrinomonadaceae bacterium]